jgi:hypothetical protein
MNRTVLEIIAVAAVAAMMSVATPIANAEKLSEKTIKSECKDAGGTYTTVVKSNPNVKGSQRFSTCSYNDNEGNAYTDYYVDGTYSSTHKGHPPA